MTSSSKWFLLVLLAFLGTLSLSLFNTVPAQAQTTVSLSASPNPVLEGGVLTVVATLSQTLSNDVRIPLTVTPGSAESGDYFQIFSAFLILAGNLSAGSGAGALLIEQDDDADDETLTVALGTLPSGLTAGSPTSVTVTIQDDDKPVVSLSAPDSVTEGSSAVVLVNLSEPSTNDRLFWLTLRRDTAEANDLLAEPWTETSRGGGHVLIIKNGRIGSFEIPTYQDDDTDDERFTVALDTTRYESMHGLAGGRPDLGDNHDQGRRQRGRQRRRNRSSPAHQPASSRSHWRRSFTRRWWFSARSTLRPCPGFSLRRKRQGRP